MKKSNTDLIVGSAILVAVVILIAGVLWLKEVSITRKMVSYSVLFPNVGTLQVGDPVMVNGVSKGSVSQIYLRHNEVATTIELEKDVRVTDSCRITVQNIGLMGERGIGLQIAEVGTTLHPISTNDTTFLRGTFDTGISEAIGMIGSVLGEVEVLAANVTSIVNQTIGDTSFVTLFKSLSLRLDSITAAAHGLIVDNQESIDVSIKNLKVASEQVNALLDHNRPDIDSIISNGKDITSQARIITTSVDSMTQSIRTILNRITSGEGTVGKLLQDSLFFSELKATVADLDTLVNSVQDDALKLRIKFGFGKNKK